jgi:MraZ protein
MEESVGKVEPPRGMYSAKVDEKGRLKMATDFMPWFNGLSETKLFVTSLDRDIAQIYPMELWRQNEKWFQENHQDPGLAQDLAFNAADLGAEAELDSQGRILLPQELRKELGIENQTVRLYAYKGRIEVLSEKVYQARRDATKVTRGDVARAEALGLR